MQLVAYGAQDIYLTGNPQITFFKVVYRRHTNFSMEAIEQTINGTVNNGANVSATISRNGDLISRLWLETDVTTSTTSVSHSVALGAAGQKNNVGYAMLKNVELEIGGQLIDRQSGEWMSAFDQLTNRQYVQMVQIGDTAASADYDEADLRYVPNAYQSMIGGFTHLTNSKCTFLVPLHFWFCRNPGLALPLIALQYHEVKVKIELRSGTVNGQGLSTLGLKLWADYIYLDTDERRRFAQVSHEYLIEQVQKQSETGPNATEKKFDLNFNHPVKELIWTASADATPTEFLTQHVVGTAATNVDSGAAQLKLNGHDRFASRDLQYFTRCQPYQHHTNMPPCGMIGVYSFALKPEEHQPSGTCNFSRIDNAQLSITPSTNLSSATINIYAVNYNVLRIMSGMGGLAYSN